LKHLPLKLLARARQAWRGSLRFRLLVLGLVPLLVAFPFVVGVLVMVGGAQADDLLMSKLRAHLSSSHNYLDQLRADTHVRVSQLVKSGQLTALANNSIDRAALDLLLDATAQSSGFDFLVVARADGSIVGGSAGVRGNGRLPDTFVLRQAAIGVANAAFERFEARQLEAFSPKLYNMTQPTSSDTALLGAVGDVPALVINAGAHFPLAVNNPDLILVGGILLNRNFSLVEHLREVVFPVESPSDDAQGTAAIFIGSTNIALSRMHLKGQSEPAANAAPEVTATVIGKGLPWLGRTTLSEQTHIAGFEPLISGDGHAIGMIGVAFPDGPYQRSLWIMLGMVAALLALAMLLLSVVFLRVGSSLTQRLASIGMTMMAVGNGDRAARVPAGRWQDELSQLGQHFNALLDRVASQDELQRAAQQAIADEASRRRARFENERDGAAILNPDGSVFEINPKCAAMLGYSTEELLHMKVSDWDTCFNLATTREKLAAVGIDGLFFETVQQRKDGSNYPAEVSLSRTDWGDKSYFFWRQCDITKRKEVEFELEQYRLALEIRVEQRTQQLKDQSEQLNAIFALSPDGFVSFDRQLKVNFVNPAFQRMTGLEHSELFGLDEVCFSAKLAAKCLESAQFPGMSALRQARKKITDSTVAGLQGAAQRQLCELSGLGSRVLEVGIRTAEAQSVSQILYARDVTYEVEVDRLKSEFLSTAAHELRTPMASIYGYSELLLMQEFDPPDRQQFLSTIYRQSELMASIINELLDLARIEARRGKDFDMKRTELGDLVAQTLADYQPPNGRNKPLLVAPLTPANVKIDRQKMQQVLLNMVSNAFKYSPAGGDVKVFFRTDSDDASARVGVAVQDQGIGMTPGQLARVCERFYRVDTSGKIPGTGLGMSIAKEIVDLFKGEIELTSQLGEGTTATVWLPLADVLPPVVAQFDIVPV